MRLAALVTLGLVAAAGCGKPSAFARTTEAVAPPGAAWSRATLTARYEPGYVGVNSSVSEAMSYALVVHGAHDAKLELDPVDTPSAALRRGSETLRFFPDGHALAFARGGESIFRYVALDAGDAPVYCRHLTFGSAADPFAGAPATRDLAVAILHTARGGVHAAGFEEEVPAAASFACARAPADDALRDALTGSLVLPASPLWSDSVVDPIIACVGDLARARADVRAALLPAVDTQEPALSSQAMRAARALAPTGDAAVAEALAAALRDPAAGRPDADELCGLRAALAWSLAYVTTTRAGASDAVAATLSAVARAPEPCTGAHHGLATSARVYATRGLAAVPTSDARKTLGELAAGACESPLEAWPTTFTRWNEEMYGKRHDLACWAKAALAPGR